MHVLSGGTVWTAAAGITTLKLEELKRSGIGWQLLIFFEPQILVIQDVSHCWPNTHQDIISGRSDEGKLNRYWALVSSRRP